MSQQQPFPMPRVSVPLLPGMALIRLPFDILTAAYALTFIALVDAGIINPEDGMDPQVNGSGGVPAGFSAATADADGSAPAAFGFSPTP